MTAPEQVRQTIERALGSSLDDREWQLLQDEGYAGDVEHFLSGDEWAEKDAVPSVVGKIKRMREAYGATGAAPAFLAPRQRSEPGDPVVALSSLIALEMSEDEAVVAFRDQHMDGRLLALEEIPSWVAQAAQADGPFTRYLKIPFPEETQLLYGENPLDMRLSTPCMLEDLLLGGKCELSTESLTYPAPGDTGFDVVGVRCNGTLDDLRELASRLAKNVGWSETEAVGFILTGGVPRLREVTARLHYRSFPPALSTFEVQVSVLAELKEVDRLLLWLRERVLDSRPRRRSKKHLALAVFAAERKRRGESWPDVMSAWNQEQAANYPSGCYRDERLFARDATRTQRALLELAVDTSMLFGSVKEGAGPTDELTDAYQDDTTLGGTSA